MKIEQRWKRLGKRCLGVETRKTVPGNPAVNPETVRQFRKFGQHSLLESGTRGRAEWFHRDGRDMRYTQSLHVRVEPGQGALDYVAAVLGAGEQVTFVLVDYELGFHA